VRSPPESKLVRPKVAARRSLPIRSMAVTLAVAAKRASSSTLLRGRRAETETSMAKLRMSSTLPKARTTTVDKRESAKTYAVNPMIAPKITRYDQARNDWVLTLVQSNRFALPVKRLTSSKSTLPLIICLPTPKIADDGLAACFE
jgi:hypothetical protein